MEINVQVCETPKLPLCLRKNQTKSIQESRKYRRLLVLGSELNAINE
jgi:hypothetical protein